MKLMHFALVASSKPKVAKKGEKPTQNGPKQATLFGLKKGIDTEPPKPQPISRDSLASTETENETENDLMEETGDAEDLEETQVEDERPVMILQDSNVSDCG
jgi:hypothetical protein